MSVLVPPTLEMIMLVTLSVLRILVTAPTRNSHFIVGGSFAYGRRRKGETFKEGDRMMMVIRYIIKLTIITFIRITNINTKMILSYC